ncbi:hypothetical protein [Rhizohabitans arisaemae]|uniref:hypothetical protein n=1 Tax=Rhizohabitans arisaemae TaxID=2720610 RepID=UPI0024B269FD|nr:hypothetical protein [Rhizohabitans arisaemae]
MTVLTIELDAQTEAALDELTEDGGSPEQVIRDAILDAQRRRRNDRLRAQAEAVGRDPTDRAEAQAIMRDMDDLRAW